MLFAGGTGNPFFTTDTTAVLRAAELEAQAVLKATNVDGVYSADPKKDPKAKRYDRLSHQEAIERDLRVMDGAAFALARENRMPIIVFSIAREGRDRGRFARQGPRDCRRLGRRAIRAAAKNAQRSEELPWQSTTHDINEIKRRMQGATQRLKTELSGLRTGRASAHLLDPVMVDAYGAQMPLNQVATVSVPEPRLISVQRLGSFAGPSRWKRRSSNSNLGLSPATEGQTIRLRIPELNEERRKELVKVAHKYAETARVAVRHVRRDAMDVIKKLEKDHKISKDDHDRFSAEIQKATDAGIAEIDHMLAAKEKEILTV